MKVAVDALEVRRQTLGMLRKEFLAAAGLADRPSPHWLLHAHAKRRHDFL